MNRLGIAVVGLTMAGCGGSSSGASNGPASGSVAGQSFSAEDSMAIVGQITVSGVTASEAIVILTTWSGACTSIMDDSQPPNAELLTVAIASASSVGPGTHDISSTGAAGDALVTYAADGANCASTAELTATSGTVTYDSVTSSSITGSIDAVFSSGEVKGTFTAPICNESLSSVEALSSMTGTCQM